jgi:uncharacterized protein (DUF305 family)
MVPPRIATLTAALTIALLIGAPALAARQEATPTASVCDVVASPVTSPNSTPQHGHMVVESPEIEFDLLFIDLMVDHHEGAIIMAQVALERGEHAEVRALAAEIIAAQTTEIAQLEAWRDTWFPNAERVPLDTLAAQLDASIAGMMDMAATPHAGMMDAAGSLVSLCAAGEPFDLAFIDAMIPHHDSAIAMANVALERSSRPEIKELALTIIEAQATEIELMRELRSSWYGQ